MGRLFEENCIILCRISFWWHFITASFLAWLW